jgi:hypothetical protein
MAARGTNRTARRADVPRQRTAEQVVVGVLGAEEPHDSVVRLAARTAHEQDLPLHMALTAADGTSIAHSMAVMDDAVSVARACCPGIQLSVSGPFAADDASILESLHEGQVRLVVCSSETRDLMASRPDLAWLTERPLAVV